MALSKHRAGKRQRRVKNQDIHGAELRVEKFKASRCVYIDQDTQEVELKLKSTDGEIMNLIIPFRLLGPLIMDLTNAHEAISPPLYRGFGSASWDGMG